MADAKAQQPEKKIGPFHAGIGVAVWLNVAETDDGPRPYRTATTEIEPGDPAGDFARLIRSVAPNI